MAKKKKLTEAERAEWDAQRAQMRANAQRTRELAERAQAKLDATVAGQAPRERRFDFAPRRREPSQRAWRFGTVAQPRHKDGGPVSTGPPSERSVAAVLA